MRNEGVLITGVAGFIGFHTAARFLSEGHRVVGVDNLNAYYDPELKRTRLAKLMENGAFSFHEVDIGESELLSSSLRSQTFRFVIHLAAQAGVRYSITHPQVYVHSNLVGFLNVLEESVSRGVKHFLFASSSSVYGMGTDLPFQEAGDTSKPVSFYAATKKSNEVMAHAYAATHDLPATGLRFFTVYGPWGRPDMAYSLFARAIYEGEPIMVFNQGNLRRDFTYIDDIVEGIHRIAGHPPSPSPVPFRTFNIGRGEPVALGDFIATIESLIGKPAIQRMVPMQVGDVTSTHADISALRNAVGYDPKTTLRTGLESFVHWFGDYYGY